MSNKEDQILDVNLPKEEKVDFLKNYVEPHTKVSREVIENDIIDVMRDAHILYNLCYTQRGAHQGAFAVAHPQINDKDPLRFFVTKDKKIIINPVITRHTNHTIDSKEACLSFPERGLTKVQRWNKCEVEFQTLDNNNKLTERSLLALSGLEARIFQHEIDHMDGKFIFNIE